MSPGRESDGRVCPVTTRNGATVWAVDPGPYRVEPRVRSRHQRGSRGGRPMNLVAAILAVFAVAVPVAPAAAAPEGQMTWALHISLAPTWFDPAETAGTGTPFLVLYALHDALVKPMPGNAAAPSLAESWNPSKDGLVYEFVLRQGARFHNGEPVTGDDVKFSFERYR